MISCQTNGQTSHIASVPKIGDENTYFITLETIDMPLIIRSEVAVQNGVLEGAIIKVVSTPVLYGKV